MTRQWGPTHRDTITDGPEPSSIRALAGAGRLDQPGAGRTVDRFVALAQASRRSLSDGRLLEAHADAQSILLEAGWQEPEAFGLLGVWASEGGPDPVRLASSPSGTLLHGTKAFCSGAPLLDHALVTAAVGPGTDGPASTVLALIDLRDPKVRAQPSSWCGLGMRGTRTCGVELDGVAPVALVGDPGWYLDRPGFWHGAVGVAASWFGGAIGVLHTMRAGVRDDDPHALAHLGEADATAYSLEATLERAAYQIDEDPLDRAAAHRRALEVRRTVAAGCLEIVEHAGGALGPRALAFDGDHAQRVADLDVYVRQEHGRRDSEALGRLVLDGTDDPC